MTEGAVYAADQLFATLDPTLRRLEIEQGSALILADTVGFIRHLPHDLVEAFRSTLQETREAELLLHVIDASDEEREDKIEQVNEVLREIGAEKVPQIAIYNKIDCTAGTTAHVEEDAEGKVLRVYLSAATGEGVDLLQRVLHDWLSVKQRRYSLQLPPSASRLRARLYELGAVVDEHIADDGTSDLDIRIEPHNLESLRKQGEFAALLPPS